MLDLLRLIVFLLRSSGRIRFARAAIGGMVLAGVTSGMASVGLIVLINAVLSDSWLPVNPVWAFALLCLVFPLARLGSELALSYVTEGSLLDLRVDLSRRILASTLPRIERLGPHRLLASLTGDVQTITAALIEIPLLCRHLTTVAGCLVFMAFLSWQVLLGVLAFLALGVATYRLPVRLSLRYFGHSRELADRLYQYFRAVTEGVKELMVHRPKARDFMSRLLHPTASSIRDLNIRAAAIYAVGNSWGQVLFFVVIGLTLFVAPALLPLDERVTTGFTLAILFMLTPLDVILNVFPRLSRANVSVAKLRQLGLDLEVDHQVFDRPVTSRAEWRRLELADVYRAYQREGEERPFVLGPVNLALEPGELVFVVGGNGSGKTTLVKLIVGLYAPQHGEVRLDGVPVSAESRSDYRQMFSVTFSPPFLFDELIGIDGPNLDERAAGYLDRLELRHKVRVQDGRLSTVELSQGQRKRLALLAAYLEDRPIYVFDEWAADQDPEFKEVFYRRLLPELRERGKTVVVITHDDRYFSLADRLIKLENGRVHELAPGADPSLPLPAVESPSSPRIAAAEAEVAETIAVTGDRGAAAEAVGRRRHRAGRAAAASLALALAAALAGGGILVRQQLTASLPERGGEVVVETLTAPVHVEWDAEGVPTVRSASRRGVAWGTGFTHAQDRFFQMDLMRRQAAGELSELFGAAALERDRELRIHRFRTVARHAFAVAPPEQRELLAAYADGVNRGLASLAAEPPEYLLLRAEPRPWQPEDSLLVLLAMFLELQDERGSREAALGDMIDTLPEPLVAFLVPRGTAEWDAPLVGDAIPAPPVPAAAALDAAQVSAVATMGRGASTADSPRAARSNPPPALAAERRGERRLAGSNSWAVAGSRTSDGRAILANDMHLELGVPNLWYRAAFEWPSARDGRPLRVVGATLPGTPLMAIGSNGFVAWGLTNSWGDWSDLVALEPADADGYRTPGGALEVERTQERIRVKGGRDEVVTVATTVWGPLVGENLAGRRLALRWVAHDPEAIDIGFHRIEEARSAGEALDVAVRSGGPQLCVTVADAGGHIGWTLTGRIPRRRGHDGRVPASWADGSRGWSRWLWPEEVPRVVDPPEGYLWTANNRLVDGPALARLGDGGYFLGARARQIRDRLSRIERADEAAMLALQLDDRALFLERWRGLLLALLDQEALRDRPLRRQARELVVDWGGRAAVDSVGFRLVRGFRELVRQSVFDGLTEPVRAVRPEFTPDWIHQAEGALWQLVSERPPHLLPAGAETWRALLLSRFDDLLDRLVADGGDLADQTWGRSNRVEVRHPLSRFVPGLGRWFDMPPISLPGADDMPRVQTPRQGASQRMVVAPGREGRGMFHMPGGQSGHPLSPHYDDLQAAWAAGAYRPLLPGAPRATLVARPPAEKRGEPR